MGINTTVYHSFYNQLIMRRKFKTGKFKRRTFSRRRRNGKKFTRRVKRIIRSAAETKYVFFAATGSTLPVVPAIVEVTPGVTQGVLQTSRIGNKIQPMGMSFGIELQMLGNGITSQKINNVRVLVYKMKDRNQAIFQSDLVMSTNNAYASLAPKQYGNVKFMKDKRFHMGPHNDPFNGSPPGYRLWNWRIPCRGTWYYDDNTNFSRTPYSNLFIMIYSDVPLTDNTLNYRLFCAMYYKDL